MEICPVFIEHVPKLLQMRRELVENQAKFPAELLNLFENMETRTNPWGIAPGERGKWSAGINAPAFTADTEYLFFTGCAGALESRSRQVSLATATLLDAAGVSWGILGKDEKCCGDSLRRLGNEFVFERMALENLKLFKERGVKKIITQCPHCFSTFKNDYQQFGEGPAFEVIHHSQLIPRLVAEGKLKLKKQAPQGSLVYHDSCYLGRHNGIYEAPRQALKAATGEAPREIPRNRERSFCCGAGGGRMWMEESLGTRINLTRVREALAEKPDTIATACPYCMTMFEDGLKDEKADEKIRVKDIAEITAECL
jgi:Fe-S oxidoreductase